MRKNLNKSLLSGRFIKDKITRLDTKLYINQTGEIREMLIQKKMQEIVDHVNTLTARIKRLERMVG